MKNCFILAATIQSEDKLYVLTEILNTIKLHFSDCKIFVGINYDSLPQIESMIDSYNLDCTYSRLTDEGLYSYGDESAYQVALNLMINDGEVFDLCWFMHTKGGHNNRDFERGLYLNNFFTKRSEINAKFEANEYLGSYGYRCMPFGLDPNNPVDLSDNFMYDFWNSSPSNLFKYSHCPVLLIETIFCMRASLVYKFIEVYPNFLHTKLRKYFFECEFCNFLPTRLGFTIDSETDLTDIFTEKSLIPLVNDWIETNNLTYINKHTI
jgi:hypothetical protein